MTNDEITEEQIQETSLAKKRKDRMKERNSRQRCLIYPEDQFIGIWDAFMVFLLFSNCILMPYQIAFEINDMHW